MCIDRTTPTATPETAISGAERKPKLVYLAQSFADFVRAATKIAKRAAAEQRQIADESQQRPSAGATR